MSKNGMNCAKMENDAYICSSWLYNGIFKHIQNDLSDICCSLGISTEGNKADLVQRLKDYQVKSSHERNVEKGKFSNDGLQISIDNESVVSTIIQKMMKLEKAMLDFNDKLNSMALQVQET
ncbi:34094_t:CDS:2, partial [Racocetra persica]